VDACRVGDPGTARHALDAGHALSRSAQVSDPAANRRPSGLRYFNARSAQVSDLAANRQPGQQNGRGQAIKETFGRGRVPGRRPWHSAGLAGLRTNHE
jgi:hypothetical protein